MRPLLQTVVALCLIITINALPENIEDVKQLPQSKEPVVEAEESEPQTRLERSYGDPAKGVLAALQSLPGAEFHTQQSYEGCSSESGCAGLKLKDGKVIERFGNVDALKAASAADVKNEFLFHAPGFGSEVFNGGIPSNGPFWWMSKDSPFKAGADFKKFSQSASFSSNTGGAFSGADIATNPFLNGQLSGLTGNRQSSSSSYEFSSSSSSNGGFGQAAAGLGQGSLGLSGSRGFAQSGSFAAGSAGKLGGGYVGSSPRPFSSGSNVNLIQSDQKNEFDFEQQVSSGNVAIGGGIGGGIGSENDGDLQQTCAGEGYVCVPRAQCNNGVVNTNGAPLPQASTKKQYCNLRTEICCRIETAGFGSNVQGSGLFSQSASNSISGSTGAAFGSSYGTKGTFGNGVSVQNSGASGSIGFGSTLSPTTVYQSSFEDSSSAGSESASVYRPGAVGLKPGVPYLPPIDSSSSNVATTAIPRPTYTTPRPTFTTPRPTYLPPSTNAPGYLPPIGEQSINRETVVTPGPNYVDGSLILDENRLPRPRLPVPPAPVEIPSSCAAALKCTPIEYCTAEGVISNTTVALTRDQDAYRVPLTDCKDLSTGRVGKCCRDPFYTDPWPVNQIGQWVPGVFGGNDGKYVPDSRGSGNELTPQITARPPITGSVILPNFRITTKAPFQKGGQGQGAIYGQVQVGKGQLVTQGQGQLAVQGQGVGVSQGFGTQGQGQVAVQGQGVGVSQGFGTQGQGQLTVQGQGVGVSQGFGTGIRQGQGSYVKQGQGQIVVEGQGQAVTQGFGQGVSQGAGAVVTSGQGQIVSQGQGALVSQGVGQGVIQGQGAYVTQGEGQIVTQGQGQAVSQGFGTGVIQGQGAVVTGGQGQAVTQGFGQGIRQGQGSYVTQGQGAYVTQGFGQGIRQGQGFTVTQNENEYSESVQRVFLQPYNAGGQCGVLKGQKPFGNRNELEVDFAEIPWQAMILHKTKKSLLCGGVITRPDVVITSASCLDGLDASVVQIKGGEWKLGVDEEPLPFQIVQVKTILRHPFYVRGSFHYDAAILVLQENLRFANNIYPICLPGAQETFDAFYNGAGECIVTGWGKSVLQSHLLGSIMHSLNISPITPGECQAKISQDYSDLLKYYDQDSCVCGQPTNPLNNICAADIGSALACTTGDGHYVLRGVYSWDTGCQELGNQLGIFYKFDVEWYEWAIGLIESVRFAKYSKGSYLTGVKGTIKVGQAGVIGGGQYNKGIFEGTKGTIKVGGQGQIGVTQGQFGVGQGQIGIGQGQLGISQGQFGLGQIGKGQFGQTSTFNIANEIKPGVITYSEKVISEPKFVTYTTKPEIISYTTKPEIFTYTTKPKIVTYTTKPEIVTFTTKPEIVTFTTKPEYFTYTTKPKVVTYTTKPKIVTFTTKPQYITYETSGSGTNPQYAVPGVSFKPSFTDLVDHVHTPHCKCNEGKK